GYDLALFSARHPARTDLRVQVDIDFVFENYRFIVQKTSQQLAQALNFPGVLRVGRTQNRTWPTPDVSRSMQSTPHGFGAHVNVLFPRQYLAQTRAGQAC